MLKVTVGTGKSELEEHTYTFKQILLIPGVYVPVVNRGVRIVIHNGSTLPPLFIWNGTVCPIHRQTWETERFVKSDQPVTITFSNEKD